MPKQLIIRDSLPRNPSGKVLKRVLRAELETSRMTQAASAKVTKLNRVERNAWTKQKIFEAATRIVGKYGYQYGIASRLSVLPVGHHAGRRTTPRGRGRRI